MVVGSSVSERYGVLGVHALFAQAENFVNLVGVPTFDRRGMNAESGCGVEQEALSNVGLLTGPTGDFAGIAIFADEEATTLTIVNLVGGILVAAVGFFLIVQILHVGFIQIGVNGADDQTIGIRHAAMVEVGDGRQKLFFGFLRVGNEELPGLRVDGRRGQAQRLQQQIEIGVADFAGSVVFFGGVTLLEQLQDFHFRFVLSKEDGVARRQRPKTGF